MYFYTYNHRSEHVYPTYLFVQSTYKRGVFYVCRLYKELSFILLFFLQSALHNFCVIRLQRKRRKWASICGKRSGFGVKNGFFMCFWPKNFVISEKSCIFAGYFYGIAHVCVCARRKSICPRLRKYIKKILSKLCKTKDL